MIAAAGNENDYACNYWPACAAFTITVGAYDSHNTRSSFSNKGDCIDAWGPGGHIRSSLKVDRTYGEQDGTSMV